MEPSEDEVSAAISKAFQLPSVKPEQLQVVVSVAEEAGCIRCPTHRLWEECLLSVPSTVV